MIKTNYQWVSRDIPENDTVWVAACLVSPMYFQHNYALKDAEVTHACTPPPLPWQATVYKCWKGFSPEGACPSWLQKLHSISDHSTTFCSAFAQRILQCCRMLLTDVGFALNDSWGVYAAPPLPPRLQWQSVHKHKLRISPERCLPIGYSLMRQIQIWNAFTSSLMAVFSGWTAIWKEPDDWWLKTPIK